MFLKIDGSNFKENKGAVFKGYRIFFDYNKIFYWLNKLVKVTKALFLISDFTFSEISSLTISTIPMPQLKILNISLSAIFNVFSHFIKSIFEIFHLSFLNLIKTGKKDKKTSWDFSPIIAKIA